ncbi:protein S100-A1-like isoform X3 [Aquarana catesbeiana]|uniref:protein S100-A1-like isoform X3 n=1 Tax=Aquarana catesbeiana TaxID=8400 RepID=UPI003CC98658
MTAILKPTNKMFCLLIFLSLFYAYSTKVIFLEKNIKSLAEEFNKIAKKEGNTKTLNVNELKENLKLNPIKELDENGDGEVDFQEFVILVASLTVACNTFFCESS